MTKAKKKRRAPSLKTRLKILEGEVLKLQELHAKLAMLLAELRLPYGRNCNDCGYKLTSFDVRCPTHPFSQIMRIR